MKTTMCRLNIRGGLVKQDMHERAEEQGLQHAPGGVFKDARPEVGGAKAKRGKKDGHREHEEGATAADRAAREPPNRDACGQTMNDDTQRENAPVFHVQAARGERHTIERAMNGKPQKGREQHVDRAMVDSRAWPTSNVAACVVAPALQKPRNDKPHQRGEQRRDAGVSDGMGEYVQKRDTAHGNENEPVHRRREAPMRREQLHDERADKQRHQSNDEQQHAQCSSM
jgi:hypothetical protein